MILALARKHQDMFETLLESAGVPAEIELSAPRAVSPNPLNKVLGGAVPNPSQPSGGVIHLIDRVIHSTGVRSLDLEYGNIPASIAAIGKRDPTISVMRCRLRDVLEDPAMLHGPTRLDNAARVIIRGEAFEVLGTDRSGLPPLGPYIFWAGLRRVSRAV